MANDELKRLRAEARARHNAATRKASRLRSQGVEITGSAVDPRRELKKVSRYTQKQLQSYIASLNAFTDRKAQYVPSVKAQPMRRELWREYKKHETALREQARRNIGEVAHLSLPGTDLTVGERMGFTDKPVKGFKDYSGTIPSKVTDLKPGAVASEAALKKLIATAKKKLSPKYQKDMIQEGRQNAFDMTSKANVSGELDHLMRGLSDKQFKTLWNYSPFLNHLKLIYEYHQALLSAGQVASENEVIRNSLNQAKDMIKWAEELE